MGATQAKHVLHASVFLRVGRRLISRTRRLEAQRCCCTIRTTAQQLASGRKNQCVRCVRVTISSSGRYLAVLVFLRKEHMAYLQEKRAGTVQVVDGCGSVALYDRTEGCDVLTNYNQHADVVVTRVVLPDSTSQVCLVPDEMIEQLRVDKALTSVPTEKKARPRFGSRAKSVWEERRCYTSHRPSARESCRRLIYGERSPQIRNTTRSLCHHPTR